MTDWWRAVISLSWRMTAAHHSRLNPNIQSKEKKMIFSPSSSRVTSSRATSYTRRAPAIAGARSCSRRTARAWRAVPIPRTPSPYARWPRSGWARRTAGSSPYAGCPPRRPSYSTWYTRPRELHAIKSVYFSLSFLLFWSRRSSPFRILFIIIRYLRKVLWMRVKCARWERDFVRDRIQWKIFWLPK